MHKPEFSLPSFKRVRDDVRKLLDRDPPDAALLNNALRILAKYRSHLIQWEMAKQYGGSVLHGPFAGMNFIDHGSHGSHVPKLLGCYERELHHVIEAVIADGYDDVVNIGCAEGYYAVGLALRMPKARIHAFDIDPRARDMCLQVSKKNGVSDRVVVNELFTPDMFGLFASRKTFFLIDIEGNELDLIGKAAKDDLVQSDFVIECHDEPNRQIAKPLSGWLQPTHALALVAHRIEAPELPSLFESLGDLDRLLAIWEWRTQPTPWLVAATRRRAGSAIARVLAS